MIKTYVRGTNKRLSENFLASEFMCKGKGCCSSCLIDDELVKILQQIRDHFGKPLHISSGFRCEKHNKLVGGSSDSYHKKGMAADIWVDGVTMTELAKYAESIGVKGIGLYNDEKNGYFVHIDTRVKKFFWYGQNAEYRSTFGGSVQKPVETVKKEVCDVNLPVLRKGMTGSSVKAMQILLTFNGCSCGSTGADGNFGKNTAAALIKFQSNYNLSPDGVCGEQTWSKLLGV